MARPNLRLGLAILGVMVSVVIVQVLAGVLPNRIYRFVAYIPLVLSIPIFVWIVRERLRRGDKP